MVNGVHVSVKDAFPTEAVKAYHEKPIPTVAHNRNPPAAAIFQPRSSNETMLRNK